MLNNKFFYLLIAMFLMMWVFDAQSQTGTVPISDLPDRPTCWDGSDPGQYACPPKPTCGLPGQPSCSPVRTASTDNSKGRASAGNGVSASPPIPNLIYKIESTEYVTTYWIDAQGEYHPIYSWSGEPSQDGYYYIYIPEAMYYQQLNQGFGLYAVETDGEMLEPFEFRVDGDLWVVTKYKEQ